MTEESDTIREAAQIAVEVSPAEPDAGTDVALRASAAASLVGATLLIRDAAGEERGRLTFRDFDGDICRTDDLVVRAPATVGPQIWKAEPSEGAAIEFELRAKAHRPHLLVWDVPKTLSAGEAFQVRIGVKCGAGCCPGDWRIEIEDHESKVVAAASPSGTPSPGTTELYVCEVDLIAPAEQGLHGWRARVAPQGDFPHEERVVSFGVRVVPAPEVVLRVEATDPHDDTPVAGARVVAHPYRAVTDANGRAELNLPKGTYTFFVSSKKHVPYRQVVSVTEDALIQVELQLDYGLSEADIWA